MFEERNKNTIISHLKEYSTTETFRTRLQNLLVAMCNIDTVPSSDVHQTAKREDEVFTLIREILSKYAITGSFIKHPINSHIYEQKEYTPPYYQEGEDYSFRYNLLHIYNGFSGKSGIALNAHIDVVPPYFPPKIENGIVIGRGASDDKGCCVAIIGALILLKEIEDSLHISPSVPIVSMFVIDEESGGNGSLSVSLDSELAKKYDTVIVVESTEGKLYPANRGALWFKVDTEGGTPVAQLSLMFHIVRELELAGKALREESEHPLFPTKPVQTCVGIIGDYGEHPARTCNLVILEIEKAEISKSDFINLIESGLFEYISLYTDRTKDINSITHEPKLLSHYEVKDVGEKFLLAIYGTSVHMGKALEFDSAIVKAAFITQPLYEKFPTLQIGLYNHSSPTLSLEGGQGFLPTHSIEQVKEVLEEAIVSSWETYSKTEMSPHFPKITFDKLHNDAYECSPSSPSIEAMKIVAKELGIDGIDPIEGFPVSCDARIFAHHYRDKEVITCGPGTISFAHTDNEQIGIEEITLGATQLALSILLMSESITEEDLYRVFTYM